MCTKTDTRIKIDQGQLLGKIFTTDEGFEYVSFSGIPYAKPPIGPLRFRCPQPAEGWVGVRDATAEGDVFIQIDEMVSNDPIGSEDGLFINVNVPRNRPADKKLPVMVYVCGGAFFKGTGNKAFHGPDYLLQKEVIVVTFNYRLGLLGFLCLNTPEVPGNAALKDQVMALHWVKNNIEQFGGNRDNVTLFGNSAGSMSISVLIISPMAEGLFHRVIMQSGTCFNDWIITKNPEESAFKYAERFGVVYGDKEGLMRVLSKTPASNLINMKGFRVTDEYSFTTVIEKPFHGVSSIITEPPRDIIAGQKYKAVPCIVGFTSSEGVHELPDVNYHMEFPLTLEEVDAAFESQIPQKISKEKRNAAMDLLKKQYFSQDKHYIDSFIDMKSDVMFIKGIDEIAKLLSRLGQPVFYYNFCYHGSSNFVAYALRYRYKGAAHADELTYMFKMDFARGMFKRIFEEYPQLATEVKLEKTDRLIMERMVSMWTNFAKYGNPTPETNEIITTVWKPIAPNEHNCLEINDDLRMTVNPLRERMQFWDDFKITFQ